MADAIVTQGLSHWFGEGNARWQALHDVSLRVPSGSLAVLSGPSGCGKSTLLTLMGALRHVQQGSVQLLGAELRGADATVQQAMRRRIGVIFQAHNLHDSLSAAQNVLVGLQVHGRGGDDEVQQAAAVHLLRLLGLSERAAHLPAKLSGGERQRVAIARALVSNPEVVLADEPTAALDSESSLLVVNMLKALGRARGVTTVMITHDDRIHHLADKVLLMQDGRVVNG
jgi:putative ABC transport system ATP-binding protein